MARSWGLPPERFLSWCGLGGFVALVGVSCGTDVVGVETCRRIERARCDAAVSCGLIENAEACKFFVRDHCLHGVALDEDPGSVQVERCVASIELAGTCAERRGKNTPPERCRADYFGDQAESICEIVQEPELARHCEFLAELKEEKPTLDEDAGSDK